MVARDEGIFAKHGLDADMTLIGINTNIPPGDRLGFDPDRRPDRAVFLQAVDGGLDLVAVAGASVMDPVADNGIAAVARKGVTIKEPKDFIGKKVGAPGIGAFLDVLFRNWLIEKGVDPKSVNFVEVTFPTMSDALKSGSVDAVVTAEPFIAASRRPGTGEVAAHYVADLNRNDPIISYAATRSFAEDASRRHQGLPRGDRRGGADRQRRPRESGRSRSRNSPRCRSISCGSTRPTSRSPS